MTKKNQQQQCGGAARESISQNDAVHEKTLNFLHNQGLIDEPIAKQVLKNHKQIAEFIEKRYINLNSKKTRYTAVVHYLKIAKAPKKLIDYYSDISTALNKEVEKKQKENTTTRGEYTLEEVRKMTEDLPDTNKNEHFTKLLFKLNTDRPPIRLEWLNVKIQKEARKGPAATGNWVVLFKNGRHKLVLNEYKTRDTYGRYIKNIPQALSSFISESLNRYPRELVLDGMSQKTYNNRIKKVLGERYSQNDFRHIYASSLYATNPTLKQQEELAADMLTSVDNLQLNYNKPEIEKKKKGKEVDKEEPIEEVEEEALPPTSSKEMTKGDKPQRFRDKPLPPTPTQKKPIAKPRPVVTTPIPAPRKNRPTQPKKEEPCSPLERERQRKKIWEENNKLIRKQQGKNYYQMNKAKKDKQNALNRIRMGKKVTQATIDKHKITQEEYDAAIAQAPDC